ncbi:MAG: glycyl-radical enzyme activating protein [Ruminococcaceae bacterium]|nr:glycyl-radical enzyme activating protein [Oscillospiraceae bacterium]
MERELNNVRGRIFNIQRFSIHDGPGVRTIIFLKGCPLRCKWCCNPESQGYQQETITIGGVTKEVARDVTVGEVIDEIEKDRAYYRRSGYGGITLSGGECLWQPDFSEALLRTAKSRGISTAIETTGYADMDIIRRLLPHIDTVLMDIKHVCGDKHQKFTTKDNSLILENAKHIAREAKCLIIRTPVVPTFNDTEEEIASIAKFASSLEGVKEMHLLPYHRIGSDKYAGLGRAYEMAHISPPTKEHMQVLCEVVKKYGLECQIGG